jgi:hypothetical protein
MTNVGVIPPAREFQIEKKKKKENKDKKEGIKSVS